MEQFTNSSLNTAVALSAPS